MRPTTVTVVEDIAADTTEDVFMFSLTSKQLYRCHTVQLNLYTTFQQLFFLNYSIMFMFYVEQPTEIVV